MFTFDFLFLREIDEISAFLKEKAKIDVMCWLKYLVTLLWVVITAPSINKLHLGQFKDTIYFGKTPN